MSVEVTAMRIVKEAEERKNEILDAASELFARKGFDGTSTGDILEKVGIARGTLYYHFKSKEDIMDALIERIGVGMLSTAGEIAADKSIPVSERIIRVLLSLNVSESNVGIANGSTIGKEMIEHMHNPQNALMHQKSQKMVIAGITPILTDIIREGITQGLCSTPFPYECMEMIMAYTNTVFDGDDTVEMTAESRVSRIEAFTFNVERLLGAKSGSFAQVMMRIFGGGN